MNKMSRVTSGAWTRTTRCEPANLSGAALSMLPRGPPPTTPIDRSIQMPERRTNRGIWRGWVKRSHRSHAEGEMGTPLFRSRCLNKKHGHVLRPTSFILFFFFLFLFFFSSFLLFFRLDEMGWKQGKKSRSSRSSHRTHLSH